MKTNNNNKTNQNNTNKTNNNTQPQTYSLYSTSLPDIIAFIITYKPDRYTIKPIQEEDTDTTIYQLTLYKDFIYKYHLQNKPKDEIEYELYLMATDVDYSESWMPYTEHADEYYELYDYIKQKLELDNQYSI